MTKNQRALVIAARAKLRKLTYRCDDSCPGWGVFDTNRGFMIQSCDACWFEQPNRLDARRLTDEEASALPEALAALAETLRENREQDEQHVCSIH